MSSALEDTVAIVKKQIEKLDKDHDGMIDSAGEFTKLLFSEKLFQEYNKFHLFLTNFVNSLIPITAYLPNEALPTSAVYPQKPMDKTENLFEKAKVFNTTVGLIVMGIIIAVMVIASYQTQGYIPWVIPVGLTCFLFFMAVGGPERISNLLRKEKDEDYFSEENPTEWIAQGIQKIRDDYDNVRLLILAQNVDVSQLSEFHQKMNPVFFSREQHEKELFPTECFRFVDKVTVFCNNAFYLRKGELMAHLPGGQRQALMNQPNNQVPS